jgi:hypothetical protein
MAAAARKKRTFWKLTGPIKSQATDCPQLADLPSMSLGERLYCGLTT